MSSSKLTSTSGGTIPGSFLSSGGEDFISPASSEGISTSSCRERSSIVSEVGVLFNSSLFAEISKVSRPASPESVGESRALTNISFLSSMMLVSELILTVSRFSVLLPAASLSPEPGLVSVILRSCWLGLAVTYLVYRDCVLILPLRELLTTLRGGECRNTVSVHKIGHCQ